LDNLARMCCRWADDFADVIRDHDPDMGGLINRVADNWRPLFAIADAIGSDWPDRIRQACAELMPSSENADSTDTMLLADIKAIFDDNGTDRLSSEQICEALVTLEGHPWAEFGKAGKPITKNKLAYRLDRFGIRPATKRIGDRTAKGYDRHQFEEAWSRYLTVDPPSEPSQRHNSDETGTSSGFQNVTQNVTPAVVTTEAGVTFQDSDVTFQECEKAASNGHCDGVTFLPAPPGTDDAITGKTPRCAYCGKDGTTLYASYGGSASVWLHRSCQAAWQASFDDLDIPAYLDRRCELGICTGTTPDGAPTNGPAPRRGLSRDEAAMYVGAKSLRVGLDTSDVSADGAPGGQEDTP
jgi:hypothetical protein